MILWADCGNRSISYADNLCDGNFIRLRRIAGAVQQTWDRLCCIGAGPRQTNTAATAGLGNAPDPQAPAFEQPSSEREMFTRAVTSPFPATRVDFAAQFGVEWLDPTADRKLLKRLLTFPAVHIPNWQPAPGAGTGARTRSAARLRSAASRPRNALPDQSAWFA